MTPLLCPKPTGQLTTTQVRQDSVLPAGEDLRTKPQCLLNVNCRHALHPDREQDRARGTSSHLLAWRDLVEQHRVDAPRVSHHEPARRQRTSSLAAAQSVAGDAGPDAGAAGFD